LSTIDWQDVDMHHERYGRTIDLWVALMQAQGSLSARLSDRLEREAGIPLPVHEVLVRLAFAPDGVMRMQELADSTMLSKSGLTRLCDRMEAAGYIKRQTCASDRRGVHAVLTAAGRRKFERSSPVFLAAAEEMLASALGAREREALTVALQKVVGANDGGACWTPPAEAETPRASSASASASAKRARARTGAARR
jgi:DNA-binding MarR family transcriptional regulator